MTKEKPGKVKALKSNDELPDDMLDKVAGGGNRPTATQESTGSIKTL